jgi:hypothetical protein
MWGSVATALLGAISSEVFARFAVTVLGIHEHTTQS